MVLGWAQATQRDGDGFFTTSTEWFETSSYPLTSAKVDLGDPGPNGFGERADGVVRVRVDGAESGDVFVGIARDADVEAYLAGVPHDAISTTENFGRSSEATTRMAHPETSRHPAWPMRPRRRSSPNEDATAGTGGR